MRSYLPAIGIGIVAGVRSMVAPALVSRHFRNEDRAVLGTIGTFMTSALVSRVLQAGAAAEMAADKTALVPNRTALPSLAWRAVVGGLAGSVVAGAAGESRLVGGLVAAGAAVGAAYAAFHLRHVLNDRLHVPDRLLGAAEDSLVLGAGRRLLAAA